MATEVYTLKIEGLLGDQYRLNTLHFLGSGVDTNDTHHAATDLLSAFNLHARTPFLACLPSSYHFFRLSARRTRLKPSAYAYTQYSAGAVVGTRGTHAATQQACPSIFLVPMLGFTVGGRIFMPCIPKGDLIQNTISAAWQTAMDTFVTTCTGGIAGTSYTWQLVIYSHKTGGYSQVASHSLSPFIGFVQKRKLISGRGRHKKNH